MVAALVLLAFLSPGAWLVVTLPPQPIAQALHLATAALWVAAAAWLAPRLHWPPHTVLYGSAGLLVVTVLSLVFNVFPVQQALYDLYGEMPGVLWLVYPVVFLVAACLPSGRSTLEAMRWVMYAGAFLVAVMVIWRWNQGFVTTFGSPAYSVPALAPLVFMAFGLARASKERAVVFDLLGVGIAAGLSYAAAGLSALFMLGMGFLLMCAVAPQLLPVPETWHRSVRLAGVVVLVVVCIAVAVVQVPAIGSRIVSTEKFAGAEQTVATRLYLWDAAQRMVAERPVLGYGPAGYRFFAADYYDPGLFAFIAGAGSDPTAFSAPSPHSLLWESLTRLGTVGLLALLAMLVAWMRRVRDLAAMDPGSDARALRMSLAVGFAAYLFSLLVTPVHFASGLLGVVVGGFAIAQVPGSEPENPKGSLTVLRWVAVAIAVLLAGYGVWRMAGLNAGTITGQGDISADIGRVERTARIMPGEPLNERRRLELGILAVTTPSELAQAREAVDVSPDFITGFAPNLVQFAYLGLSRGEALGITDFAWERSLLDRVAAAIPDLPSLVAEQLHYAVVTGDTAALPALVERAQQLGGTYPMTADYIARAEELLAR